VGVTLVLVAPAMGFTSASQRQANAGLSQHIPTDAASARPTAAVPSRLVSLR
jgi:hypothetical protein